MGKQSDNRLNFSVNAIRKIDPPTDVDKVIYYDGKGTGLSLSVFKSGKKCFTVYYPIKLKNLGQKGRKQGYYNLGNALNFDIDEARKIAAKIIEVGEKGIDYKDYVATEDEIISKLKTEEQVEVSLGSVGDLPGQIGHAWNNLIKRKFDVGYGTKRNLKTSYRKHVLEMWPEETWMKDITEQECIEWKAKFFDRKNMWNKVRVFLNQAFKDEVYNGRLSRNVLSRVPEYPSKEGYCILTDKGVKNFFDIFLDYENTPKYARNYARYIALILLTGQRPINLRSLKNDDDGVGNFVDWTNKRFVYRIHKTSKKTRGKAEYVNFNPVVEEIIKDARAENPDSSWAIPSVDWRDTYKLAPLHEERARDYFNLHRNKLEIEGDSDLTLYKLRHTFATRMYESGCSIDEIATVLLHTAGSRVTYRYAKISDIRRKNLSDIGLKIFPEIHKKTIDA